MKIEPILCRVSAYSSSTLESDTIPAEALNEYVPLRSTAVLMHKAVLTKLVPNPIIFPFLCRLPGVAEAVRQSGEGVHIRQDADVCQPGEKGAAHRSSLHHH